MKIYIFVSQFSQLLRLVLSLQQYFYCKFLKKLTFIYKIFINIKNFFLLIIFF